MCDKNLNRGLGLAWLGLAWLGKNAAQNLILHPPGNIAI
jgi:hypothetical protein